MAVEEFAVSSVMEEARNAARFATAMVDPEISAVLPVVVEVAEGASPVMVMATKHALFVMAART